MFKTLRFKLLVGITPLLALLVGLGLWAILMFSRLGSNIDVILKENYRSVLAAEGMKEALERMDRASCSPSATRRSRPASNSTSFVPGSRRTCASSAAM